MEWIALYLVGCLFTLCIIDYICELEESAIIEIIYNRKDLFIFAILILFSWTLPFVFLCSFVLGRLHKLFRKVFL